MNQRLTYWFLSCLLFYPTYSLNAAIVKKVNGQIVEGRIKGSILVRDMTGVKSKAGKPGYSASFTLINGKNVYSIDENGVGYFCCPELLMLTASHSSPIVVSEVVQAAFSGEHNLLSSRMKSGGNVLSTGGTPSSAGSLFGVLLGQILKSSAGRSRLVPFITVIMGSTEINIAVTDIVLSSSLKTRLSGVEKITNQLALAKSLYTACNQEIVEPAMNRLTDQAAIAEVAKNAVPWVRADATRRLTDQTLLADIVKHDYERHVRKAAVEKLTDQAVLADVAKNDDREKGWHTEVDSEAVEKLTDQALLADVAKNACSTHVQKRAVEKLTDQAVLADVAKNNNDIGHEAVEKLTDQALLADLAKNSYSGDVREAAAKKLTDQAVQNEIAKNESDRRRLIERLTDQTALAEIAKNDSDIIRRILAIIRLRKSDDRAVYSDVAKNGPCPYIRALAITWVRDYAVLTDIAKNDSSNYVRYEAFRRLEDNQAALVDIAKNAPDIFMRRTAIHSLKDQAALTDISKNDPDIVVKLWAKERLIEVWKYSTD